MPLVEVEILRKESQVDGSFNNGEILEKKPIGFPCLLYTSPSPRDPT